MAYYRWTVLEKRLMTHFDLRLGLGKYASQSMSDLKENLPKYVLCVGAFKTRRLIMNTLSRIKRMQKGQPFELILFYAEGEEFDDSEVFYELLQRVVSQQIAPIIKYDVILTVKILPGSLLEGLNSLKKNKFLSMKLFLEWGMIRFILISSKRKFLRSWKSLSQVSIRVYTDLV